MTVYGLWGWARQARVEENGGDATDTESSRCGAEPEASVDDDSEGALQFDPTS